MALQRHPPCPAGRAPSFLSQYLMTIYTMPDTELGTDSRFQATLRPFQTRPGEHLHLRGSFPAEESTPSVSRTRDGLVC